MSSSSIVIKQMPIPYSYNVNTFKWTHPLERNRRRLSRTSTTFGLLYTDVDSLSSSIKEMIDGHKNINSIYTRRKLNPIKVEYQIVYTRGDVFHMFIYLQYESRVTARNPRFFTMRGYIPFVFKEPICDPKSWLIEQKESFARVNNLIDYYPITKIKPSVIYIDDDDDSEVTSWEILN